MPDFNKKGTFNQDANFQGVKFGADAPLLETELNELQDIQTEARADIIRDTIPSGFVQLGELDFDYMLNNENCVKLKTDSVAYVNGYKIKIPKDTIVDIGRAPERDVREDLLFLEVWKEEVTKDSQLTINGGVGQAPTTNNILDPRVGQETSRRVVLKWRIRHVKNVNFKVHPNGLRDSGNDWQPFECFGQGGREEPLTSNLNTGASYSYCQANHKGDLQVHYGNFPNLDRGLYICGNGYNESKTNLKTLDGYCYAIPMFKLYRRPGCGKAKPFEYQKINPKVDYSKFNALMNEEKVESVINDNIKGQSLVNLCSAIIGPWVSDSNRFNGYFLRNGENLLGTYTVINLSPRKVYIETDSKSGNTLVYKASYGMQYKEKKLLNFSISSNEYAKNLVGVSSDGWTESNKNELKVLLLEGDWTDKEIPEYFTGLKSLGEKENNLIEVKNSILNESSYDPDTENLKLSTLIGTNHIRSTNTIKPSIEAKIMRGDITVNNVTNLGKIETKLEGNEVVEFIKIKGKTLQNLSGVPIKSNLSLGAHRETTLKMIKPNTTYTQIVIIENNTLSPANETGAVFGINEPHLNCILPHIAIKQGFNGVIKQKITTSALLEKDRFTSVRPYSIATNGSITVSEIILEGDYTNIDVPLFTSFKSVGDYEKQLNLNICGKNLFNNEYVETGGSNIALPDQTDLILTELGDTKHRWIRLKLEINKTYTISMDKRLTYPYSGWSNPIVESYSDSLKVGECYTKLYLGKHNANDITVATIKVTKPYVFIHCGYSDTWIQYKDTFLSSLQIEENTVNTPYESYKEHVKKITLKEPLRSLPSGVCDTIEGNKVIRRIGEFIVDGSIGFNLTGTLENTLQLELQTIYTNMYKAKSSADGICDTMPYVRYDSSDYQHCRFNGASPYGRLGVWVDKTNLISQDLDGVKDFFTKNPMTVYYELANPIEEYIEPNYDKESVKTYQLDAPLRSLPNGVKDEIVNNTLIRRCGEIILDGTQSTCIQADNSTYSDSILRFEIVINTLKPSSAYVTNVISDTFPGYPLDVASVFNRSVEGITNHPSTQNLLVFINKSRLSPQTVDGFKAWLKTNPVKVLYELQGALEIPLKEIASNKVDFSKQRLFKSGNYLREIPSSNIKDKIENGKVKRYTKKLVLNGSESWVLHNEGVNTNTLAFHTSVVTDKKPNTDMVSDKFDYKHSKLIPTTDEELISGQLETSTIYIRVLKSKLATLDDTGFKNYLKANPVQVIYELETPVEETLDDTNNKYCPNHSDFNTYCGSLYVGDGTNDLSVNSVIKADSIIANTDFRSIENKGVVTDCNYKKTEDGYTTLYSYKPNLISPKLFIQGVRNTYIGNSFSSLYATSTSRCTFEELVPVIPGAVYSYNLDSSLNISLQEYDAQGNQLKDFGWASSKETVTLSKDCHFISCNIRNNTNTITPEMLNGLTMSFELGTRVTNKPYVDFYVIKPLENTEENDVEDLRYSVSLTGFNNEQLLRQNFEKLLRGKL